MGEDEKVKQLSMLQILQAEAEAMLNNEVDAEKTAQLQVNLANVEAQIADLRAQIEDLRRDSCSVPKPSSPPRVNQFSMVVNLAEMGVRLPKQSVPGEQAYQLQMELSNVKARIGDLEKTLVNSVQQEQDAVPEKLDQHVGRESYPYVPDLDVQEENALWEAAFKECMENANRLRARSSVLETLVQATKPDCAFLMGEQCVTFTSPADTVYSQSTPPSLWDTNFLRLNILPTSKMSTNSLDTDFVDDLPELTEAQLMCVKESCAGYSLDASPQMVFRQQDRTRLSRIEFVL